MIRGMRKCIWSLEFSILRIYVNILVLSWGRCIILAKGQGQFHVSCSCISSYGLGIVIPNHFLSRCGSLRPGPPTRPPPSTSRSITASNKAYPSFLKYKPHRPNPLSRRSRLPHKGLIRLPKNNGHLPPDPRDEVKTLFSYDSLISPTPIATRKSFFNLPAQPPSVHSAQSPSQASSSSTPQWHFDSPSNIVGLQQPTIRVAQISNRPLPDPYGHLTSTHYASPYISQIDPPSHLSLPRAVGSPGWN
jgi:hypothetical protein